MLLAYYIFTYLLISANLLPYIGNQHWIFRVWEFGRIQLLVLQIIALTSGIFFIVEKNTFFWITHLVNILLIINNVIILIPYTVAYKRKTANSATKHSKSISIISVNVYQFNNRYQDLINLVNEIKPDILLTLESNQAWENALTEIETEYTNFKKVPLENTYGIHFYTKLKPKYIKVNYFIADDVPSIEALIVLENGASFTFFGVHPPPPSPTEEENSKERDGELLAVGKKIKDTSGPVIVVGDFNNVAWAKSSVLFRKTSELIDPRIGRGFVSTFHARYRLLRFPIDLFFHSPNIFVEDFKTLRNIGSDHLPLFSKFFINHHEDVQEEMVETLATDEKEKVEEMIEDGIVEKSDRPKVVTEEN